MTFLTELKRLNAAIPAEQNALTRCWLIQQRDALLANHADDIVGLVEAANKVITRWDTPAWKDVGPTADVINEMRAALTKLKQVKL